MWEDGPFFEKWSFPLHPPFPKKLQRWVLLFDLYRLTVDRRLLYYPHQ